MSSAFTDRMGAIASPLGLRFNGEAVTREIGGDTGDTASQTAIVNREGVTVEQAGGEGFAFDYQMEVATTSTVALDDTYLIGGERCRVVRIGDAINGLRPVWLTRLQDVRSEAKGDGFIR